MNIDTLIITNVYNNVHKKCSMNLIINVQIHVVLELIMVKLVYNNVQKIDHIIKNQNVNNFA